MLLFTGASHLVTLVQGRVVVIARVNSGGRFSYFCRLQKDDHSWASPQALTLPNYPPDPSVKDWLDQHANFKVRLDYNYATATVVPDAPFQAVSDDRYIHLFRQSPTSSIYVDRFVFNATSFSLDPVWQVRYQSSRQRYQPADKTDTQSYVDNDGKTFYEPTTELKIGHNLAGGAFSVVRVPSATATETRWQIVSTVLSETNRFDGTPVAIVVTGYGYSEAWPFDVNDKDLSYTDQGHVQTFKVAGFAKWTVALPGLASYNQAAAVPAATLYHARQSVANHARAGTTVIKNDLRMMIALAVDDPSSHDPADDAYATRIAVLDLAVGLDGNPARPAASMQLAALALGDKPSLSKADYGLTYAGYVLSLSGTKMWGAPSLLDSSDGFVHLRFLGGDYHPVAMFYDTKNGWWANVGSADSGAILNPPAWVAGLGNGVKWALPPPGLGHSSDPGSSEVPFKAYLVNIGGQLWSSSSTQGSGWSPDPDFSGSVVAVSGSLYQQIEFEWYLIDGDNQLWHRLGREGWARDQHHAPATVLAVSGTDEAWHLVDGDNKLWYRASNGDWGADNHNPPAVVRSVSGAPGAWCLIDVNGKLWYRAGNDNWGTDQHNPPAVVRAVSGTDVGVIESKAGWYLIDGDDHLWYRDEGTNWTQETHVENDTRANAGGERNGQRMAQGRRL